MEMKAAKPLTMEVLMKNESLIQHISNRLIANLTQIQFGIVAVILTVHQAKAVGLKFEITEKTTVKEEVNHHENV